MSLHNYADSILLWHNHLQSCCNATTTHNVSAFIRPYNDEEWNNLPHISLTSDSPWDPSIIDNGTLNDYNGKEFIMTHGNFDNVGDLLNIEVSFSSTNISVPHCINNQFIHSTVTKPTNINYGEYDKYFLKAPHEVIKKTFEAHPRSIPY